MSRARERADSTIEGVNSDDELIVDLQMPSGNVVREPRDARLSCEGSHEWAPEVSRRYDLPDPDPRNPMRVYECLSCPAERHCTAGFP